MTLKELNSLENKILLDEEHEKFTKYYEEIDIKDFEYDSKAQVFSFPCPCGDRFEIPIEDILNGEEIASCLSCPLIIRVVYEEEDLIWIEKLKVH